MGGDYLIWILAKSYKYIHGFDNILVIINLFSIFGSEFGELRNNNKIICVSN